MRILIINDFYQKGGAEVQAGLEMSLLRSKGHSVFLLTFDPAFPTGFLNEEKTVMNVQRSDSGFSKTLDKLRSNPSVKRTFKELLKDFRPDVIHLENCIKETPAVFSVLRKHPDIMVVQTIHDYGCVCPLTGFCAILPSWKECPGYFAIDQKCVCKSKNPLWKILKTFEVKRYAKLILQHHIRLISPSEALSAKLRNNGFVVRAIPNLYPSLERKHGAEKKDYVFAGNITAQKGIVPLLKAFALLGPSFHLTVVGPVSPLISEEVSALAQEAGNVALLGAKTHEETLGLLRKARFLVVPSLWLENYPNTILEAFDEGTPVLGSNRGGIKEMVGDERLLFDVLDEKDIARALSTSAELDSVAYAKIVKRNHAYLKEHNDPELYYKSFMEVISC